MMYSSQNITCYLLHNLECLGHFSSSLEPLEGPVGHEGIRGRRGHPPCGTRPSVRAGRNWSQVGSQVQSAWKIEILQSQRNHITQVPTSIIFVKKMAQRCGVWQIKRLTSLDQDQVSKKEFPVGGWVEGGSWWKPKIEYSSGPNL